MRVVNVVVAVGLLLAYATEARKDSVKRDVVQQARERVQARNEDADVGEVILEVLDYIMMKLEHIEYELSYHAPGFPNPAYPYDPALASSSGYYGDNSGYTSDPWTWSSTDDYGSSSGDYDPGHTGYGYGYGHDSSAGGYDPGHTGYSYGYGHDSSAGGYDPGNTGYGYGYGHDSSAGGYDHGYGGYDPSSDWYDSSDMYDPSSSYSYDPYYDYHKRNKGAKLQKKKAETDLMKLLGQLKGELNKRKTDTLN